VSAVPLDAGMNGGKAGVAVEVEEAGF